MNGMTFSPALGPVAGPVLAVAMLALAVAYAVGFVRRRADTDATVPDCVRRILIAVTLGALALTPSTTLATTSRAVNATDVFVAVDVTGSMAVADAAYGSPDTVSRIDAARRAIRDIVRMYPDASFSGVSFGVNASLDVPLTPDGAAIENWADTLAVESTAVSAGSSLDAPIDRLLLGMKAANDRHPDDATVLYLITDGEQTSTKTRRTYSSLRAYVDDAFVIGVGSAQGGMIPTTADGAGATGSAQGDGWVIDPSTGQPGVSRLDEDTLRAVADELSGAYEHVDDTHTVASGASAKTSGRYRLTVTAKERERVAPVVWPCYAALLVLLAWEAASWIVTSRRLM